MKIVLDPAIIIIGIVVVVVLGIIILSRYRRCPDDQIMVVRNKFGNSENPTCIHGGRTYVWPIIQEVQFLDLKPVPIEVELQGALSRMNNRVGVSAVFTVGVSTDPYVMPNAAKILLGRTSIEIRRLAEEIIRGELRIAIAMREPEEINERRNSFVSMVSRNVEESLAKIGMKLIEADIADIRDETEEYNS